LALSWAGQPEPEREHARFQKRSPGETYLNDAIIYNITTRLFESGIFVEDEWTAASRKTGKVPKTEVDEVYFGNFGRGLGLREM